MEEKTANLTAPAADVELDSALKPLLEAGVFFGKRKSKTHPKMRPFILQNRNGIEVINLHKTLETLERAVAILKEKVEKNGLILFVATQPTCEDIVSAVAQEFSYPMVNRRWIGGTITNFGIISKRIDYMRKLKTSWETGGFEKYTKKERAGIQRQLNRLQELLGGLDRLNRVPDAMVVIDPHAHLAALAEAKQAKIPVIALTNVDFNPERVDYPIVGNTNGRASVSWFIQSLRDVIVPARMKAAAAAAASAAAISATNQAARAENSTQSAQ